MGIRSATVCALGALVQEYVYSCAIELHRTIYPRHSKVLKYVYGSRYVFMFLAIPAPSIKPANLEFWNDDCVTIHPCCSICLRCISDVVVTQLRAQIKC
jgi:hypothetical protein